MPKLVDYQGRFMFFQAASFALVRDHGVHHLSRHRVATKLGTSISTVRRLLSSEADLRNLALTELAHRRRQGRYARPPEEGAAAALWLLRRFIPDSPDRIAEELVWWRLNVAAPTRAHLPLDEADLDEGPLHHRFAVATHGFVPDEVLSQSIEPPSPPEDADGAVDLVVAARDELDLALAQSAEAALSRAMADLQGADLERAGQVLHALLEGLSIGVCLGRLTPTDAVAILQRHLAAGAVDGPSLG